MRITGVRPWNPGLARHLVTWQEKAVTTQDSYGQDTFTWLEVITVYARVEPLRGRELEMAAQTWADARYKVEHQWHTGLERAMRILWKDGLTSKYLDVLDVYNLDGMHGVTTAICREWAE